jgi:threonine dehydrogenase-like Zn-dependent dehydrogenase
MTLPRIMPALQLRSAGRLEPVQLPVPQPCADELLIRTGVTTICTSDLHDIDFNPFGITLPRVPGHEGAGVVAAVGAEVKGFAPGDPVAAHPVIPCRRCEECLRGLGHLCSNLGHLGLDRDGTFAGYFCIRADRARKVPAELLNSTASLLEPVAVCLEAIARGRIQPNDAVVVVGDGPFGLIIARLAAGLGAKRVVVVGRHDFRLGHALGAVTINETRVADAASAIREANDGSGVDVAIMAAARQAALDVCLAAVRARGRVVAFSALTGCAHIDLFRVHARELELCGACNDEELIEPALVWLMNPMLRLSSLVTHRLPFEEWPRAFELARCGRGQALKVALTFPVQA